MPERKLKLRITSFDVAAAAGVSQSTVSRALAGSPSITEETRERVKAAAERLGYVVDARAAMLRRGQTGTIAVVVICRTDQAVSDINPFYFALLGAVCAACAEQGFETLVSFQASDESLSGRYHERGQADGVIVIGTTSNNQAWSYFRGLYEKGAPIVFWGSPFDDMEWVRSDNVAAGRMAVEILRAAGRTEIVHLGTDLSAQRQFAERYAGYSDAMRDAGLTPRIVYLQDGLSRLDQGRAAVAELLASGSAFDAIFAACDSVALGAIEELRAAGVNVPHDCAVLGFDGIREGAHSSPALTTIQPDFEAAGHLLVRKLLFHEQGRDARRVPVHLVRRQSV